MKKAAKIDHKPWWWNTRGFNADYCTATRLSGYFNFGNTFEICVSEQFQFLFLYFFPLLFHRFSSLFSFSYLFFFVYFNAHRNAYWSTYWSTETVPNIIFNKMICKIIQDHDSSDDAFFWCWRTLLKQCKFGLFTANSSKISHHQFQKHPNAAI